MSRILKTKNHLITNGFKTSHQAVDVVGEGRTLDYIIAHTAGTVNFCQKGYKNNKGSTGNASYGNCVKIKHKSGYETLYAHMKDVTVSNGQSVSKGQVLGYMSDSGNAYGSHLHFELRKDGKRINPTNYLNADLPDNSTKVVDYTGKITYQTYDNVKGKWLPEVVSNSGYAGNFGNVMSGVRAKCEHGEITIQTHIKGGVWLSKISSKNYVKDDKKNGATYSGIFGKSIDAVRITSTKGYVKYRVHLKLTGKWLDWVDSRNANKGDGSSFAGILGKEIDAIEMK